MKLWHVEFILQDKYMHETLLYLEEVKAYNVRHRPLKNGAGEETEPKTKARSAKGIGKNEISKMQQEWIARHVKDEVAAGDLTEKWTKAGFRRVGLYGALAKAVKDKVIKKTAAKTYKPAGA